MVYKISYKTLIGTKPLHIRFDQVHGFMRVYDGTRYSIIFETGKYCAIFNRIRFLIWEKSGITYVISNYKKIKIDSSDSFPLEKTLIFYNLKTR